MPGGKRGVRAPVVGALPPLEQGQRTEKGRATRGRGCGPRAVPRVRPAPPYIQPRRLNTT